MTQKEYMEKILDGYHYRIELNKKDFDFFRQTMICKKCGRYSSISVFMVYTYFFPKRNKLFPRIPNNYRFFIII